MRAIWGKDINSCLEEDLEHSVMFVAAKLIVLGDDPSTWIEQMRRYLADAGMTVVKER